jgi:lysophospholipase L1-like esterase
MKKFPARFIGAFLLALTVGFSGVVSALAADATVVTNATAAKPHDFARWEKEIAAYEQKDKLNPPPKNPLLFTGASMITKWTTLPKDFPGQPVMNRGVGGSEVKDITHFADRIVFPYAPRMIFFRSGGNDIHYGESVTDVFADYKEFVATVHAKLPETEIIFIALSPSIARWEQHDKEMALNAMIKDFSKQTPHLGYIDDWDIPLDANGKPRPEIFVADMQHFNAEGYKMLAERVRPYLPK